MPKKYNDFAVQVLRKELRAIDRGLADTKDLLFGNHHIELHNLRGQIARRVAAGNQDKDDWLTNIAPQLKMLEKKCKASQNKKAICRRDQMLLEKRIRLLQAIDFLLNVRGY